MSPCAIASKDMELVYKICLIFLFLFSCSGEAWKFGHGQGHIYIAGPLSVELMNTLNFQRCMGESTFHSVVEAQLDCLCHQQSLTSLSSHFAKLRANGVTHFKVALPWSRILPEMKVRKPNKTNVECYRQLLITLRSADLKPILILHQHGLPKSLGTQPGFTTFVNLFAEYADFSFRTFGELVDTWITFSHLPEVIKELSPEDPKVFPLQILVSAHQKAYKIYREKHSFEGGKVSISLDFSDNQLVLPESFISSVWASIDFLSLNLWYNCKMEANIEKMLSEIKHLIHDKEVLLFTLHFSECFSVRENLPTTMASILTAEAQVKGYDVNSFLENLVIPKASKCVNSHWRCAEETCLIQPKLIEQINSGTYGWKADNYSQFWGMSLKEGFNYRLGTFHPSAALLDMRPVTENTAAVADFPEFFVASYEWPGWIHDPLDQRNCAASWAFSTASVAADRTAIHSQGHFTDNLSPQNLISCAIKNQQGCKGGSISNAWSYIKKYGLVSHACYPLFWNQLHPMTCAIASVFDAEGKRRPTKPCPNQFETSNRIYQCGSPYRISSKEADIMKEIKENGPVQAIMKVYDDFFLYKSGIYRHTIREPQHEHQERLHSVKLVGWGTLEDAEGQWQKYWIAANSWGISWGENGYFRILRGQNECDIEKLIIATKCHL